MASYIANAFSLNMVSVPCRLRVEAVSAAEVPAEAESAIGHESTAKVLTHLLGRSVAMNRVAISLAPGDSLYLAAVLTPDGKPYRPPEGKVLSIEDLARLRLEFRRVTALVE